MGSALRGFCNEATLFMERPLCVPIRMGPNVPEWARMGLPFKPEWAWSNPVLVTTPHANSGRAPITEATVPTPLDYLGRRIGFTGQTSADLLTRWL